METAQLRSAPLGGGDIEPIVELVRATEAFRLCEIDVARELLEAGLEGGEASGYLFRVVWCGERIAGYACWGPTPCTEGTWDLYWIATDPRLVRQGVASFLLDEVEADVAAKGGRLLVAETSDTPAYGRARGFYLARGFSVAATVADFYQVGDGKVIFVKRLAVT